MGAISEDVLAAVRAQIAAAGLTPPPEIVADGQLQQWAGAPKRPGDGRAFSWYRIRELTATDGGRAYVGLFGDLRLGFAHRLKPCGAVAAVPTAERQKAEAAVRRAAERLSAQLAARAKARAGRLYARLAPASGRNAWGVGFHGGARQTRGGALVVPAYAPAGALVALQFIPPPGAAAAELRPYGCEVSDAAGWVGPAQAEVPPAVPVVVAEGYAAAASIHEATDWPVAIALQAANVAAVVRRLAPLFPGRVWVAGDAGAKAPAALKRTLAAARAHWVVPHFAIPPHSGAGADFNALHRAEGLAAVRDQLLAARAATEPESAPPPPAEPPRVIATPAAWQKQLRHSARGLLLPTVDNIAAILSNDERWADLLAWCDFSNQIVKRKTPPWGGAAGDWSAVDAARARLWIAQQYAIQARPRDLEDAIVNCADACHVHPVRDYLQCAETNWDQMRRAPTWLRDFVGADDSDYHAAVGVMWLISAVARVMQPPCKADGVLVLEGPQGRKKSTVLQVLGGEWFSDTPLNLYDKDAMGNLPGVWIQELQELLSLAGVPAVRQNAFFSSATDRYRPVYGRHAANFPRQCVFAGTTNRQEHSDDPTGARRFWGVRCGKLARIAKLERLRDQLWGEAVARWRAGERWWPEGTEMELFAEEQALRFMDDPLAEPVEAYLNDPTRTQQNYFSLHEILEGLGFDISHMHGREGQQIAAILHRLGWQKERPWVTLGRDQVRRALWRRPAVAVSSAAEASAADAAAALPPPSETKH